MENPAAFSLVTVFNSSLLFTCVFRIQDAQVLLNTVTIIIYPFNILLSFRFQLFQPLQKWLSIGYVKLVTKLVTLQ